MIRARSDDDDQDNPSPPKKKMLNGILSQVLQEDKPELMDLPQELKTIILEFLPSEHRFKFASCSYGCFNDMLHSIKHVRRVKFLVHHEQIEIRVQQEAWKQIPNKVYGFQLIFVQEKGTNYMKFLDNSCFEAWKIKLTGDLMKNSIAYLKLVLKYYQSTLQVLEIKGIEAYYFDFEIRNLEQLQDFEVWGDLDVYQFVAKTGRHLKRLCAFLKSQNVHLPNCQQVHQIGRILTMPSLQLNNKQFEKIRASLICIHIGSLTPIDIFTFLWKWQNELIGRDFDACTWCLMGSNFNSNELLTLLWSSGVCDSVTYEYPSLHARYVKIRLESNPDYVATLLYNPCAIRFDTKQSNV